MPRKKKVILSSININVVENGYLVDAVYKPFQNGINKCFVEPTKKGVASRVTKLLKEAK